MPRAARKKNSTGIYHIVLRGINKQPIFEDDEDNQKFIEILEKYKETSGYQLYAYCLMSNHLHLLLKEGKENLETVFRRIGASYVYWYNWKYSRRGHLFQDRYKSEAVETDTYFLTVLRYIHQNPVKAGITEKIQTYPWSSYREYTEKPVICATQFAMGLFSEDKAVSLHSMEEFHQEPNKDQCLEPDHGVRINDLEAAELIQKIAEVKSPQEIQAFEKQKRNAVIKELKKRQLSIRQIERLTGISFGIIRKL